MAENVLLRFLNNGLIDVGGDDTKLDKLQGAAKDLAALLKKHPSRATSFALIAFDPDAPPSDPVVVEALAALQSRWTTYRNTFSSTPIAVVRATLIDALFQAAADDDRVGVSFVSSARNLLPFTEAGEEREIWSDLVSTVEKRVNDRAEAEWATPGNISTQRLVFEIPQLNPAEVSVAKVERTKLTTSILLAAGPQYISPQGALAATNGNAHWPQTNPPAWSSEFAKRMSAAIGQAVDGALEQTSVVHADLSDPFNILVEAIRGYMDGTLKEISAATAGLQRRTNLIWWKEALFSPSARISYRDLPVSVAAAQMAFDLHQLVPTFSPASVSAFLYEAVGSLPTIEVEKTYTLRELVAEAQTHASLGSLRAAGADLVGVPQGRGLLLALISHPSAAASTADGQFRRLTGMQSDTRLTAQAWAAWLFRELQAARAGYEGVTSKQRARKA